MARALRASNKTSFRRPNPWPGLPHKVARSRVGGRRAVETRRLARDRAVGLLLFYSGMHVAELVALDVADVPGAGAWRTSCRRAAVRGARARRAFG
ncbi:hypothetical protein [Sphaerisporangium album]|uniref:hypothetical protein n=1 Tax=Sphaerisporangium album TaxID=509200 RepID=UPI001FE64618|nr:hypothetical protein [Sphaerisporangium album]